MPDNTKQNVTLTLTNNSSSAVMFKWKSTRPGIYKMRPVFGKIAAGDHANIQLIFKGIKPGTSVPMKDHYTCILTTATQSSANVEKLWKNHKHKREIANQALRKHKLQILYKGYNDQVVEMTPLEVDLSENRRKLRVKKGKGLVDEEDEKPTTPAAAGPAKNEIQVMFREQACPLSDSDSEKEGDEGGETNEQTKSTMSKRTVTTLPSGTEARSVGTKSSTSTAGPIKEMTTAPAAKLPGQSEMKTSQLPTDVSKMKTAPPAVIATGVSQMKTAPPAKLDQKK